MFNYSIGRWLAIGQGMSQQHSDICKKKPKTKPDDRGGTAMYFSFRMRSAIELYYVDIATTPFYHFIHSEENDIVHMFMHSANLIPLYAYHAVIRNAIDRGS